MNTRTFLRITSVFLMMATGLAESAAQSHQKGRREYAAPAGSVRVTIVPVGSSQVVPNTKAELKSALTTARLPVFSTIRRKIASTVSES